MADSVSVEVTASKILTIRGKRVILDSDLAKLYGVETKHLNRQVRRNIGRFPSDFMIQLTRKEYQEILRCQIGTSSLRPLSLKKRGGRFSISTYSKIFSLADENNRG